MRVSGVSYEIDWSTFTKGTSITIPCVDPVGAEKEVKQVTDRLRMEVLTKVVIEDGVKGLRVWRM